MHHDEEQNCRRRDRRRNVDLIGLAFRRDGRRSVVNISDISFTGCQMDGSEFDENERFRLVIPERGEMTAQVRWTADSTTGACFHQNSAKEDVVPDRDRRALRQLRAFNYGTGRVFGKRLVAH